MKGLIVSGVVCFAVLVGATSATAHIERPSYWPDPAPDFSVKPPAGGGVPKARSLHSALSRKRPGRTRVVCAGRVPSKRKLRRLRRQLRALKRSDAGESRIIRLSQRVRGARRKYRGAVKRNPSIRALQRSLNAARRARGFKLRPSQPRIRLTRRQRRRLLRLNENLLPLCKTNSVQLAIRRSRNNDRVVVMPGRYTEPKSRDAPTNDPRCDPRLIQKDASGDPASSYIYQATCPNDQNLIYLQGRKALPNAPSPPLSDRRGIPDNGPCVRCNMQVEGSGVKPEDVIMDAGGLYGGKERDPNSKPGAYAKHVVFRADRADGLVARNFLMKGAREHGFYTEETDGYRLERAKFFWNADYGQLAFTSDHQLVQNCDGYGAGDAVVYPGGAPETGSQRSSFWPDAPRTNTIIQKCDLRGSALGYSGSMGNAVRITRNHIYGNTTGIASDTLSSAGHPGFPADSSEIDNNYIYSNNLDLYKPDAAVKSLVTVPIGVGVLYPGMNDARVHDNHIFDNWRDGARLFSVPDALTNSGGAEGDVYPGISCPGAPANGISTSCNNRMYGNQMGLAPLGFSFPSTVSDFGNVHSSGSSRTMPNGVDFWWDEFSGNTNNCWFNNRGPDGTADSITGPGAGTPPDPLPSDCSNVGQGDAAKITIEFDCAEGPDEDTGPLDCPWWQIPPKPGSAAASRQASEVRVASRRFDRSEDADKLRARVRELSNP